MDKETIEAFRDYFNGRSEVFQSLRGFILDWPKVHLDLPDHDDLPPTEEEPDERFFKFVEEGIDDEEFDFQKIESFNTLQVYFLYVRNLYRYLASQDDPLEDTDLVFQIAHLARTTESAMWLLQGYWLAKKERKEAARPGVEAKVHKKEQRKELLKQLLSKHEFKVDKRLIRIGMEKTDLGEKRVQDLLKEIKSETPD